MVERCDGKFDCVDRSDELNCQKLIIEEGYRDTFAPQTDEGKAKVYIDIEIDNVLELDEVLSTMTLQFKMIVEWIDPRLAYINLKENHRKNILTSSESQGIWMPILVFANTENKDQANFKNASGFTTIKINPGAKSSPTQLNELQNGNLNKGKEWSVLFQNIFHFQNSFVSVLYQL